MRTRFSTLAVLPILAGSVLVFAATEARAQAPAPTGAPPPEAKALVDAPAKGADEPDLTSPLDGTTAALSAGALLATGNSRLLAATANGALDTRFDNNGIGASVLGNYGRSATPGAPLQTTAENIQARIRYDRYVVERASIFLINTGRHDRFQGIAFRYNLDPGFKYLFLKDAADSLWAEAGYDFQYDVRRNDARAVLDANKNPIVDASGQLVLLDKHATDHSSRVFAGYRHGFNKEVTLALGVEYLQSVIESTRYRVNGDVLFAAKVGGGLAVGLGFSARFDHAPLPGKEKLDSSTTVSLIYAFSNAAEPPKPPTCPCPEPAPAPSTVSPPPTPVTPEPPPSVPPPESTGPSPNP